MADNLVYLATSLEHFSPKTEDNKTIFQKLNPRTPSIHRMQDTLPLPPPGTESCDLTCDTSPRPHFFLLAFWSSALRLLSLSPSQSPSFLFFLSFTSFSSFSSWCRAAGRLVRLKHAFDLFESHCSHGQLLSVSGFSCTHFASLMILLCFLLLL